MCFGIIYLPGCDIINFEINLTLLVKPFFYLTKKALSPKNCLRPESIPLMTYFSFLGLAFLRQKRKELVVY